MARIPSVSKENAQGELLDIYQQLEKKMGKVINIFQVMGNSPVTLKGFLALNQAAEQTTLSPEVREAIALLVGQSNQCNYCLSAHSAIAKKVGLTEESILQARHGSSQDVKTREILNFVKKVIENRGKVSDQDVSHLKHSGVSDKELVEIVFLISINLFTNYFNLIADTKIDFPEVPKI